jgi:hypothetical protein
MSFGRAECRRHDGCHGIEYSGSQGSLGVSQSDDVATITGFSKQLMTDRWEGVVMDGMNGLPSCGCGVALSCSPVADGLASGSIGSSSREPRSESAAYVSTSLLIGSYLQDPSSPLLRSLGWFAWKGLGAFAGTPNGTDVILMADDYLSL